MPKRRAPQFEVTGPARRDIAAILKRSIKEFGLAASVRYRALIRRALIDIEVDPERPGSRERPEIMFKGARTYHLQIEPQQSKRSGSEGAEAFFAVSSPI